MRHDLVHPLGKIALDQEMLDGRREEVGLYRRLDLVPARLIELGEALIGFARQVQGHRALIFCAMRAIGLLEGQRIRGRRGAGTNEQVARFQMDPGNQEAAPVSPDPNERGSLLPRLEQEREQGTSDRGRILSGMNIDRSEIACHVIQEGQARRPISGTTSSVSAILN